MKAKQSLPKLTDSELKIQELLSKKKIERTDFKDLTEQEIRDFISIMFNKLNELKGEAFDEFYSKVEGLTTKEVKNHIWERNHNQITCAISTLLQDYGRMPTIAEIAGKSELSRQTIHKHLKEYANDPQFLQITEQFRFMNTKVLARVFKFAVNGDMRAAKLYFDVMGFINKGQTANNTLIQSQNNFIQINGTVLSQETIKNLNPEQLNMIENILKAALPHSEFSETKK